MVVPVFAVLVLGLFDLGRVIWTQTALVSAAREAAWQNAEILWHLRAVRPLSLTFLDALDGLTTVAGNDSVLKTQAGRGASGTSSGALDASHT